MWIKTDVKHDQHMTLPERATGTPGPEPDRVKIDLDWEDAIKRALGKKRPPEGWPRPKKKQAKKGAK